MVNWKSKKGNFSHDCYTCNKSNHVDNHVLVRTDDYEIHYDMKHRPRIVVTPNEHVSTVSELGGDKLWKIYSEVNTFLKSYGVSGYCFSVNQDSWSTHEHLHLRFEMEQGDLEQILKDKFKLYHRFKKNHQYCSRRTEHHNQWQQKSKSRSAGPINKFTGDCAGSVNKCAGPVSNCAGKPMACTQLH